MRVLAITQGDGVAAAEGAGADFVGGQEVIDRILGGWMDFDAVVATPDMMAAIGSKLGRVLGPRGLLPNPKAGTVGPDIGGIVRALKAGQIEFRSDKTGVVHAPIGKASFGGAARENLAPARAVEPPSPTRPRVPPHPLPDLDHTQRPRALGGHHRGLNLSIPVRGAS